MWQNGEEARILGRGGRFYATKKINPSSARRARDTSDIIPKEARDAAFQTKITTITICCKEDNKGKYDLCCASQRTSK
jgi:hypothetical protein